MNHTHTTLCRGLLLAAAIVPLAGQAGDLDIAGPYLNLSAGRTVLDESVDGVDIDTDATALQLFGGWQFGEYLAVEGGYLDLGEFDDDVDAGGISTALSADADGWAVGARVRWPLTQGFALTGRAGYYFWESEATAFGATDSADGEDPYLGIGVELAFNPKVSLTGQWDRFDLGDAEPDVYSLGLNVRF